MRASFTLLVAALVFVASGIRARAADLAIPGGDCGNCPLELREACAWDHLSTQSDRDHWSSRWSVRTALEPAILLGFVNEELQHKGWRLSGHTGGSRSGWRFEDSAGRGWVGSATVERGKRPDQLIVSVSVDRPIERSAR